MAYDPTDWDTADDTAKETSQHFFTDPSGAHVTETAGDPTTGNNVLIDSGGMYVRDGTTILAEFKDPTIVGETGTGKMNIRIGNIPNWDNGLAIFKGNSMALMMFGDNSSGTIYSALGCYLNFTDGLGCTVLGKTPLTILDSNRQSDFAIGNVHIYMGTLVKNVGSSNTQRCHLWTDAGFESAFNVTTGRAGSCMLMLANTNYDAGNLGAVSADYRSGSGWYAHWTVNATGNKQFGYVVFVPDSYSTV